MTARIVLVEDEVILRLDVKSLLEDAGYDVVGEAGNGEKAIELAYKLKPDLIIMDIKMPKLNGLKASQIITASQNIPILMLTAYSQREFIAKAKQKNIVGYLVKPVSEANLIPAVEVALSQASYVRECESKIVALNGKLQSRKVVERAKGILMKEKSWDEDRAYQKMRTISMNNQISLEKVAKTIIKKYESQKQVN
ncbi:response regulator receiver and ANTAR domain protein [Scopulibacillus darangshiensis]|uniref:Response regulator receiver and ANTAR domain protein n=1 Tax=Scopulibacillus darangshiensis TaxID=442528 RepID=A0A4R2P8P9_9BACL|nr:response regulator [Scopulibacillus darangshiensis]TCP31237.1 response regulator receiver and ANTAR domain protein [Scopulibacillus darangshiensis]